MWCSLKHELLSKLVLNDFLGNRIYLVHQLFFKFDRHKLIVAVEVTESDGIVARRSDCVLNALYSRIRVHVAVDAALIRINEDDYLVVVLVDFLKLVVCSQEEPCRLVVMTVIASVR